MSNGKKNQNIGFTFETKLLLNEETKQIKMYVVNIFRDTSSLLGN